MKPVWILVLVVSALSFIEAQRSLVSLSDVITLMSFIDPNWGEKDFHFQIFVYFFYSKVILKFHTMVTKNGSVPSLRITRWTVLRIRITKLEVFYQRCLISISKYITPLWFEYDFLDLY